ncbi:MAG: alanine--tRNA ligase [Methanomassiliicoccus sp.]|nr:alanine--tRNA ligase [Methanomassiliicoccus sp.]
MSSEFDLQFFKDNNFIRKVCPKCGRAFWSQGDWETCGESPCEEYSFINNSPIKRPYSNHEMREEYLNFFEEHGHGRVRRYPIVARWREDVFFTQASIYDFQPWVLNGVVDPPFNPLTISQTCVRFNDIDNVGRTGRHYTFFEMLAHHAFNRSGKEIYFKDRTVELCHKFYTERLGVQKERMRYIEEWWEGGGNSGPCVEVILEGVELATLVFMQYRETPQGRIPMDMTVVDTGYGLERATWISQGTPSAYEAVFGPVVQYIQDEVGIKPNQRILEEYSKVAGAMNMKTAADIRNLRQRTAERLGITYEELIANVGPMEDIYIICDHSRALAFMLNDGVVPSNVREGYFARMLVRRALRSMRSLDVKFTLADIVGMQIDYFSPYFPELVENRDDIMSLVKVEEQRYYETLERGRSIVQRMTKDLKGQPITVDKLIELYDSHGLNPEIVKEFSDVPVEIPDNFYMQVAKRHESTEAVDEEGAKTEEYPLNMPETTKSYYEDPEVMAFEAEVVAVVNGAVVLDHTYFYPEGGGQEADYGTLNGYEVINVQKVRNTILHFLDGKHDVVVGSRVACAINEPRRRQLMRHHTAAHIINGSAREMLGNHVWQSGAHKSVDEARLDITHFENLSEEQRTQLEKRCNEVVLEDHPVEIKFMQRDEAEAKFGFRLYQGGVVPGKIIRVVNTTGVDVEACGGLHCDRTSRVGPIRILRTKRIQDGVVRIEYSAGLAAVNGMQSDKACVDQLADRMNVGREALLPAAVKLLNDVKEDRKRLENMAAKLNRIMADSLLEKAVQVDGARVVVHLAAEDEDPQALSLALTSVPGVIAVLGLQDKSPKLFVSRSSDIKLDCRPVLKDIMKLVGGGGGGKPDFAQGGGGDPAKLPGAMERALEIVTAAMAKR